MQQFDVVENLNPLTRRRYPFALVLQHDRVSSVSTLVVAPITEGTPALTSTRLHPLILIENRRFTVIIEELAGVQRATLGQVVGSAEAHRYEVIAAIDMLFTGI